MDFPVDEMLHNKTMKVTAVGMSTFRHGTKTVGTSAVELLVGSQPLAGRKKLVVMAEGEIYIGTGSVTVANGFPVTPGYENRFAIEFDPSTPSSVHAVANANTIVRIWEEA